MTRAEEQIQAGAESDPDLDDLPPLEDLTLALNEQRAKKHVTQSIPTPSSQQPQQQRSTAEATLAQRVKDSHVQPTKKEKGSLLELEEDHRHPLQLLGGATKVSFFDVDCQYTWTEPEPSMT